MASCSAKGAAKLRKELPAILEDAENNLTPRLRTMLDGLCTEWRQLDYDIQVADEDIERIAVGDENCTRLRQIQQSALRRKHPAITVWTSSC